MLRGNLQAGLENVALWHERDISHSSVERIILPDSLMLAYYVAVKFRGDRRGHASCIPSGCCENLDASHGLVFSQPVLLALVEAGLARDDAYRLVQRGRDADVGGARPFLDVLAEDAEVTAALDADAPRRVLRPRARRSRNAGRAVDALDEPGAA